MKSSDIRVGLKVFVPKSTNYAWTGEGEVVKIHSDYEYADLKMLNGNMVGKVGGFSISKLEFAPAPAEIVGGAPHGFGVWVDGKFHPVDIGALGKIITDLQEENKHLKTEVNW